MIKNHYDHLNLKLKNELNIALVELPVESASSWPLNAVRVRSACNFRLHLLTADVVMVEIIAEFNVRPILEPVNGERLSRGIVRPFADWLIAAVHRTAEIRNRGSGRALFTQIYSFLGQTKSEVRPAMIEWRRCLWASKFESIESLDSRRFEACRHHSESGF